MRASAADSGASLADAILAYSREFWSDPDRHRRWRLDMQSARRQIVAEACARSGRDGLATLESSQAPAHRGSFHRLLRGGDQHRSRRARDARRPAAARPEAGARHQRRRGSAARKDRALRAGPVLRSYPDRGGGRRRQAGGRGLSPCAAGARCDGARRPGWSATISNGKWPPRSGSGSSGSGATTGGAACRTEHDVRPDLIIRALSELLGHHEATERALGRLGSDRLNRSPEKI